MDGDLKDDIQRLKKRLKSWETSYEREYGHKPAKDDIDNSAEEIKGMYRKYKYLKARVVRETTKEAQVPVILPHSSGLHKEKENVQKDEVFGTFLNKKHQEKRNRSHDRTESTSYKARKWVPGRGFKTVVVSKEKPIDEGKETSGTANKERLTAYGATRMEETDTGHVSQKDGEVALNQLMSAIKIKDATSPLKPSSLSSQEGIWVIPAKKPNLHHGHGVSSHWLDQVKASITEPATTTAALGNGVQSRKYLQVVFPPSTGISCFELLEGVKHKTADIELSNVALSSSVHFSGSGSDSDLSSDEEQCELYPRCVLTSARNDPSGMTLSTQSLSSVPMESAGSVKTVASVSLPLSDSSSPCVETGNGDSAFTKAVVANKARNNSVSENFVQLNLKVKRYSRKSGRITGSRYKRLQWKQRQKGLSKGGQQGMSACFKCGRTGHWARNCTENVGYKNLGKFGGEEVEYCDHYENAEGNNRNNLEELASSSPFLTVEEEAKTTGNKNIRPSPATETDKEIDNQFPSLLIGSPKQCTIVSAAPAGSICACPCGIEPYFSIQKGKVSEDVLAELHSTLKTFGLCQFKNSQEATIVRVLSGVSTLLVQPTGSGKSLCYQLPAYLYSHRSPCLTLVISPLISLMEDQVHSLPAGLRGACMHSNQSHEQRQKIFADLTTGQIDILLLSPEAVVGGLLSTGLISRLPQIAFACIDEVHCLSEWSHNFRPSYLQLHKVLRKQLGVKCVLGLTATATSNAIADITHLLEISNDDVIVGSMLPSNLQISVSCEVNKDQALVDLMRCPPFSSCESIIVYCTRQQTTEQVAQLLRTCLQSLDSDSTQSKGERTNTSGATACSFQLEKSAKRRKISWSAECYHAGLSPAARQRNQSNFMAGKLRIIVATVAFGMGLDKSDVRAVIHYNMPKSFESYVQEIGRAGRDHKPAFCHVFIDKEGSDLMELRRHAYSNTVDHFSIKKLVNRAFPSCQCVENKEVGSVQEDSTVHCSRHELAVPIDHIVQMLDIPEEGIATLLCYMELQGWLEVLPPISDTCVLKCYDGNRQLSALSKKVPAVASAFAQMKKKDSNMEQSNCIRFSVTKVANALDSDYESVRADLHTLSSNDRGTGPYPNCSNILVEFQDQSFHLKSRGDLSSEEKDCICDYLIRKTREREAREVERLYMLHAVIKLAAQREGDHISSSSTDISLQSLIQKYFRDELSPKQLKEHGVVVLDPKHQQLSERQALRVRQDLRALISTHDDQQFTGRALARILHGISSPCYPAEIWGKLYMFWRRHLDVEFNSLCQIATEELLRFRQ